MYIFLLKLSCYISLGIVANLANKVNCSAITLAIDNQKNQLSQVENLELEGNELSIVGLWRGFHQYEDSTIYYAYNFRPDGTYLARHRVYRQEETIQDEFWEGKWNLQDKILTLEGVSQQGNKSKITIRFQLIDDNTLQYYDGSLAKPYIPLTLGRLRQK